MSWFDVESLDLCNMSVEALWARDLDAFFVFSLLCKDGRAPATLEKALERLLERKDTRKEAIATAIFFAGKVLRKVAILLRCDSST
ncbi:MAG TPA: hypothetical protein VGM01_00415 [Ktedonobacteraceae bacterium]|jgi:hypothetical protein